jgi:hypothetical protein
MGPAHQYITAKQTDTLSWKHSRAKVRGHSKPRNHDPDEHLKVAIQLLKKLHYRL